MARSGEEWAERDAAIQWVIVTVMLALGVSYLLAVFSFALTNLIPYGISQDHLKNMSNLAKAWMQGEDAEQGQAYFRVRASLADTASVPLAVPSR